MALVYTRVCKQTGEKELVSREYVETVLKPHYFNVASALNEMASGAQVDTPFAIYEMEEMDKLEPGVF